MSGTSDNVTMQLILAGAILVNMPYGMTIALYLGVHKKLERKVGAFHLGRFECWSRSPRWCDCNLAYLLMFRRHALEQEPGQSDATDPADDEVTSSKELVCC